MNEDSYLDASYEDRYDDPAYGSVWDDDDFEEDEPEDLDDDFPLSLEYPYENMEDIEPPF